MASPVFRKWAPAQPFGTQGAVVRIPRSGKADSVIRLRGGLPAGETIGSPNEERSGRRERAVAQRSRARNAITTDRPRSSKRFAEVKTSCGFAAVLPFT